MRKYQRRLARLLADSHALFFQEGLRLKDGRLSPYFVNLGAFSTGRLVDELGCCFAEWIFEEGFLNKIDLIIGPSYKGSAIAQATAVALWRKYGRNVAFDYDRKEAKTYGEATGHGYLFVTGAAIKGGNFLIVDDVGTSMSTKFDLIKKIGWLNPRIEKPSKILGVALAVDREQTQAIYDENGRLREGEKGPDALKAFSEKTKISVWSILGIKQAIEYLYEEGVEVLINGSLKKLNREVMERFHEYLLTYGRRK